MPPRFDQALLEWYDRYGRKDLPWQHDPTPYRVWVSEIMLQQTQVTTVVDYYQRFMERFRCVAELGQAELDQVLHRWSGLGYYARARNLHKTAKLVTETYDGEFPSTLEGLQSLPGIGRSTAGAILALSMGQRQPILDGNVKRVLCRYHAIEHWSGQTATLRELWQHADHHTPQTRVAEFTQAIMDLGATVCVRSKPKCPSCPLRSGCLAHASHKQHVIPAPRPKRDRPRRATTFLIVRDEQGRFLLSKRPPSGIWGGLWSFPECGTNEKPLEWCRERLGISAGEIRHLPTKHHGFTHFDLDISPVLVEVATSAPDSSAHVMETGQSIWYNPGSPAQAIGFAAPVTTLLSELQNFEHGTI